MADPFVPFRKHAGFTSTPIPSGPAVDVVVPIRADTRLEIRPLPRHDKTPEVAAPPPPPPGPTKEEVARMVAAAEEKARRTAQVEVDQIKRSAAEDRARLALIGEQVAGLQLALAAEARAEMGELLIRAVERLVGSVPELLAAMVRTRCGEVAQQLVSARQVVVRVHPDDVALAQEALGRRDGWRVEGDPTIRGGCVAETDNGLVDASLDAAMEALTQSVLSWQAEVGAEPARREGGP